MRNSPVSPLLVAKVFLDFCLSAISAQTVAAGFPISDCGTTQGCVGFPDDTCLASGKCTILLKFAYDPAVPDKVPVEIYGTPPSFRPQNFWIAVAFNSEQKMGGSLVTECVYNNGAAGVFSSRNVPNAYANQRIMLSGVVPGNGTLHNGILGCSFVLSRARVVEGTTYDLAQPFFIIAGNGPAVGSAIRQHFQRPYISGDAIIIAPQDPSFVSDSPPTTTTGRTVLFDKFLQSNNNNNQFLDAGNTILSTRGTRPPQMLNNQPPPPQMRPLPEAPPMNQINNQQQQQGNIFPPGNNVPGMQPIEEQRLLSHEAVVNMIMKFIEPPLKMIVDLLNRGNVMRMG